MSVSIKLVNPGIFSFTASKLTNEFLEINGPAQSRYNVRIGRNQIVFFGSFVDSIKLINKLFEISEYDFDDCRVYSKKKLTSQDKKTIESELKELQTEADKYFEELKIRALERIVKEETHYEADEFTCALSMHKYLEYFDNKIDEWVPICTHIDEERRGAFLRESFAGVYNEIRVTTLEIVKGMNTITNVVRLGIFKENDIVDLTKIKLRFVKEGTDKFNNYIKLGKEIAELMFEKKQMDYTGQQIEFSWFGPRYTYAKGRVVVDVENYEEFSRNSDSHGDVDSSDERLSREDLNKIANVDFYNFSRYIKGYSLRNKSWGNFSFSKLKEPDYNTNAFDLLVMDNAKKIFIKNLVTTPVDFTDFVGNKGLGTIFMLYGPPGVGKTLTAEAISEHLRRPLYSITVGELGTDIETLEKNLRNALELAEVWNAILLIDEADIYLEKRSDGDIVRNAMVTVFLRLLEYYPGILFLTTNRVDNIDQAFESRISLKLFYREHSSNTRKLIWRNILNLAKISLTDGEIEVLAQNTFNGRQIKNIIKMSIAYSGSVDRTTFEKIKAVIDIYNIDKN